LEIRKKRNYFSGTLDLKSAAWQKKKRKFFTNKPKTDHQKKKKKHSEKKKFDGKEGISSQQKSEKKGREMHLKGEDHEEVAKKRGGN